MPDSIHAISASVAIVTPLTYSGSLPLRRFYGHALNSEPRVRMVRKSFPSSNNCGALAERRICDRKSLSRAPLCFTRCQASNVQPETGSSTTEVFGCFVEYWPLP